MSQLKYFQKYYFLFLLTVPCSVGFSIVEQTVLNIKTKNPCPLQETKMNCQIIGGYIHMYLFIYLFIYLSNLFPFCLATTQQMSIHSFDPNEPQQVYSISTWVPSVTVSTVSCENMLISVSRRGDKKANARYEACA
uniref:Uncharacterized protein n=1 Tax=Anguilla anguilla TaxID=7936 RepID=A0A0E9X9I5_ANGAN